MQHRHAGIRQESIDKWESLLPLCRCRQRKVTAKPTLTLAAPPPLSMLTVHAVRGLLHHPVHREALVRVCVYVYMCVCAIVCLCVSSSLLLCGGVEPSPCAIWFLCAALWQRYCVCCFSCKLIQVGCFLQTIRCRLFCVHRLSELVATQRLQSASVSSV